MALIAVLAIIVIFVIVIIFIIVWYYENGRTDRDNLPMNFTARLITRGVWFAFPPKKVMPPFKYNPVPFIVVCHTATTPCYTQRSCRTTVRNIQSGQMESIFDDISFNYLIGGDGYIYEGRGWSEASAGTHVVDCSALSIGFIGNFIVDRPPLKQLDAFKLILEEGVALGKLDSKYSMFMQKQIKSTESPGEALIEILQSWSHWEPFGTEDRICNETQK